MKNIEKFLVSFLIVFLSVPSVFSDQGEKKVLRYSEFGAVGDGVTDDFDAIVKTHDEANKAGLDVRADPGATYYIGPANKTAQIRTNTDWSDAKFILDDAKVDVKNRNHQIFNISSGLSTSRITTVKTLRKNQAKLDLELTRDSLIQVTDNTTKRFIRLGLNQNNGTNQTDVFVVDKNGNVDEKAPIIWDFDTISSMTVHPIDDETLFVRGGHFTTIANQAESKYTYYARGIGISRSRTVIDGVVHTITGETDHGAPYGGFLSISTCANVMVRNCKLSGHKIYRTIGSAGESVSMGSYDLSVNRAVNVTFKNCKQLNDIHDTTLWGIFGSNFSKNITFDTVELSRFDAHMGVTNATIRNSILGHQGINIIGSGVFLLENTKVHGGSMVSLRGDYGSTFEGEFIIRNCVFTPRNGKQSDTVLITGGNSEQHDFGYPCFMPEKVTIDGLVVNDVNPPKNYKGPKIFSAFDKGPKSFAAETSAEKYPYTITKELVVKNLTVKSGLPWIISNNPSRFQDVKVAEE